MVDLHIGACSWKYPSWRGLVYTGESANYLQEYVQRYDTVEVDQFTDNVVIRPVEPV